MGQERTSKENNDEETQFITLQHLTPRHAAMWMGALDDTVMCDKDAVIKRLLEVASTATAAHCTVLWMRCVERSEQVRLRCATEKSEASWALAQVSTHE